MQGGLGKTIAQAIKTVGARTSALSSPITPAGAAIASAADADGSGYRIGTYIPGLAPSDPNYCEGSTDIGCLNFVNYLVRKNM